MFFEIILILLATILLGFFFNRKPNGLPPGGWGFPIIGYIPFMEKRLPNTISDLHRKHGDIFSLRLGSRIFVCIADFNLIKSVLNKPEYSERPEYYGFNKFFDTHDKLFGIVTSDGTNWTVNRRFALKILRDFGLGKSRMATDILVEASHLVDYLSREVGKPIEVDWSLNVAVLNVTWKLVAGMRYDITGNELKSFSKIIASNLEIMDGPMMFLNLFPSLIPFMPTFLLNGWMKLKTMEIDRGRLESHFQKIIDDHKQSLDPSSPRDFIDMYLVEMASMKNDGELNYFGDKNLLITLLDFFAAGSDTTSNTLRWFFMYMARYPKVQKEVQQQIDSVIPKDRFPSLEDKLSLPLLEALMNEISRIKTILPASVPHSTSQDTNLNGFTVPKDAIILPCIEICHNSSKYWERPDELYLGHFLDSDGKFIAKKEGFLPFCIGRRQCVGESMARMELFIFMGAILQNFDIIEPEGRSLVFDPDEKVSTLNVPGEFKVILHKRN